MTCKVIIEGKHKAGSYLAASLGVFALSGCVSTSWLAHEIVRPQSKAQVNSFWKTFAQPFYTKNIALNVSPPDAGVVNASLILPAHYDPEIGVEYKPGKTDVRATLNFPRLPPPSSNVRSVGFSKEHPAKAYAQRLRRWIPTVKSETTRGTVIMMSGFGLDKDSLISWGLFFADRGWRVIVVNLRGQGDSTAPYLTWGIRDRNDLHRLVIKLRRQHLLVKPWLYFGISYGAGVALIASPGALKPDGVIAIAPWGSAQKVIPRYGEMAGGWIAPDIDSSKWSRAEKQAGKLAGISFSEAAPVKSVPMIEAPVLYFGGLADNVAIPSEIRNLARKTPHATVSFVPGASHLVVSADVPDFCPILTKWLVAFLRQKNVRPCHVQRKVGENHTITKTYYGNVGYSKSY